MSIGGSFYFKVRRNRVDVVFFFYPGGFLHIRKAVLFLKFAATFVNIWDVLVVDEDQAFILVDFVASEYFNFDPFLVLWKTE